jgi:hypothetical protein
MTDFLRDWEKAIWKAAEAAYAPLVRECFMNIGPPIRFGEIEDYVHAIIGYQGDRMLFEFVSGRHDMLIEYGWEHG